MSMHSIFSEASKIYKAISKEKIKWDNEIEAIKLRVCYNDDERREVDNEITSLTEQRDMILLSMKKCKLNTFKEVLEISMELQEIFQEVTCSKLTQWYSITIRPAPNKISFEEFYDKIYKLMQRKFFKEYTLSFEQKGTSEDTLGEGFHCHIVADTKHRSVGECQRDINSTFNQWIEKNIIVPGVGIKITTCKTPDRMIENYLIKYESDDGHKIVTKEWDERWRHGLRLDAIYKNEMPKKCVVLSSVTKLETDESKYNTAIKIIENPTITFQ